MSIKNIVSALRRREQTGKFDKYITVRQAMVISREFLENERPIMLANGEKTLELNFHVYGLLAHMIFTGKAPDFEKSHFLNCVSLAQEEQQEDNHLVVTHSLFKILAKLHLWATSKLPDAWKSLDARRVLEQMAAKYGLDLVVYDAFMGELGEPENQTVHAFVLRQPEKAHLCMLVEVEDWVVHIRCYKVLIPWRANEWEEWLESSHEDVNDLEGRLLVPELYLGEDGEYNYEEIYDSFFGAQDESELSSLWDDCEHHLSLHLQKLYI